uniref:(northern house mosquito) hypothetical protein n=1 Tax=Culex pipiens TaxID=7175 RepID=A0A8D8AVJ3_CULPI
MFSRKVGKKATKTKQAKSLSREKRNLASVVVEVWKHDDGPGLRQRFLHRDRAARKTGLEVHQGEPDDGAVRCAGGAGDCIECVIATTSKTGKTMAVSGWMRTFRFLPIVILLKS